MSRKQRNRLQHVGAPAGARSQPSDKKLACLGLVRQCQQLLQRRQPPAAERRGSCRGASMRPTSSCKPAQEHFRGTMRLVKMPGDGNCLFHALAHPTGENGLRLREEMAQFLETAASEQGDYEDDWRAESEYLREDPTHWGGDTRLHAAAPATRHAALARRRRTHPLG